MAQAALKLVHDADRDELARPREIQAYPTAAAAGAGSLIWPHMRPTEAMARLLRELQRVRPALLAQALTPRALKLGDVALIHSGPRGELPVAYVWGCSEAELRQALAEVAAGAFQL